MSQTIIIGANDPNIAYLLQRYAEESGFQATPICQNDDLLDLVYHLQPPLIILDIDFIERADWEMVRRLKAEPATRHLPIVVYSCLNEPPDDWREGVDGYLLKSALYDDFVAVLKRVGSGQCANDAGPNR
jgi:CheY-like chemotaxis protein